MENIILLSLFVLICFIIFRIVEMKFIEKEWKPIKIMVRESIIVFISGCLGGFIYYYLNSSIYDFFNTITENKVLDMNGTQVFTDKPDF
jgi:cytosine/uracil/thiamine/allantoin permease